MSIQTPQKNSDKSVGGGWLGPVVAAVTGTIIAGGAAFGIVSSQTGVPEPVNEPYIVYGKTTTTS